MAAAVTANGVGGGGGGFASFERELICSICTEVLYQPLTILNCLHTFCGSCLKEWFSHQHRKASSSRSSSSSSTNPYSCPTCRAEVVDVQHNATVSNLLELFLAANPERDRSQQEKDEMHEIYKPDGTRPGDKILPRVERRRERRHRTENSGAARERQMVEEARVRSLREFEDASQSAPNLAPPRPDRDRSASAERDERRQRRRDRERQRVSPVLAIAHVSNHQQPEDDQAASTLPVSSPRHPDAIEVRQREQRMSHQASLRSLVSVSENGAGTGTGDSLDEARIMQEILDEGLLGDIDVEALTEAEQDMLAERIAELYRQRHRRSMRSSPPRSTRHLSNSSHELLDDQLRPRQQQQSRSNSAQRPAVDSTLVATSDTRARSHSSRPQPMPPTSIVRSNSQGSSVTIHHRRHNSDQTRQVRATGRSRQSSAERRPASVSASNLVEGGESRPSNNANRTNTDPVHSRNASEVWLQAGGEDRRLRLQNGGSPARSPRQTHAMPVDLKSATEASPASRAQNAELDNTAAPVAIATRSTTYEEPSISCFRCERTNIQYDIHRHCRACKVDLCMRCYREGKGCKHWYGFGHAADIAFESAKTTNEDTEPPHVLIGRQYRRPSAFTVTETRPATNTERPLPIATSSNPEDKLQEGRFCDRCGTFANSQFWLCDTCNEGEWGFCKQCVQTHHCCTHPLLPVAYIPHTQHLLHPLQNLHLSHIPTPSLHSTSAANSRPTTPNSFTSQTHNRSRRGSGYDYLSINVNCDMCHQIIFPDSDRNHCPFHQTDYDLCTSCYSSFLHHSRMRRDGNSSSDVVAGWRKCPQGHRMIILAFEADTTDNGDGGMRRIIKADLVGGWKMSEADMRLWNQQHNIHMSPPTSPPPSASFNFATTRGTWSWREDQAGTRLTRPRAATLSNQNNVTSQGVARFPPDGGFGKRGTAHYAYWPEDGPDGEGELKLPRGADVAEIEDVNGDWWSGVYAGDIGVFPFGYVREERG